MSNPDYKPYQPQQIGTYYRAYPEWNPDRVVTAFDCQGRKLVAYFKDLDGVYQKAAFPVHPVEVLSVSDSR